MSTILIIEDDGAQRKALENKFSVEGFSVDTATNGEEGLSKVFEGKPDVVLLDVSMPKMDGIEFLQKLRGDTWGKDAKVVVFTNLDGSDVVANCMEYNVFQVFLKADESLDGIVEEVTELLNQ